jgi:magnesium transporter
MPRCRSHGYLHPRDMRRLVTPFNASNEPDVIVRRHVLLLNFDPVRAIIVRDRLFVLVPQGADSLLLALEQRVRGGAAEAAHSVLGGSSDTSQHDVTLKKSGGAILKSVLQKAKDSLTPKDPKHNNYTTTAVAPIHKRVSSHTSSTTNSSGLYDDGGEWDDMNAQSSADLPFELHCVDAVIYMVTAILSEDTFKLQQAALGYIQDETTGRTRRNTQFAKRGDDPLLIIRRMKDAISEMNARVEGFVKSMNRILDWDEGLALMNLTRLLTHPDRFIKPVDPDVLEEETDEPELILEAHLQVGLTLENGLGLLQGQLDTASEHFGRKLDAMRNRILFANMIITVCSLCVGTGSFVGSVFGMNVTNHIEDSDIAFKIITGTTVAGSFCLGAVIMLGLIWSGTIVIKDRGRQELQ